MNSSCLQGKKINNALINLEKVVKTSEKWQCHCHILSSSQKLFKDFCRLSTASSSRFHDECSHVTTHEAQWSLNRKDKVVQVFNFTF